MITKDKMAEVFADTEKFYKTDKTLKAAVANSIAGTKFFSAEDYPALPAKKFDATKISVTKQRTFEAAAQLHKNNPNSRIAVHNFASATTPGGGVKNGSRAQEEALCRCSTLYPALNTDENWIRYYKFHRDRRDSIYTDACIFAPEIIVCKSDIDVPQRLPQKDWIKIDVITCAAPNLHAIKISDNELLKIHEKRARHMLTVLASCGVEIFVTGAFGCGAFRNNPYVVAQAYKNILPEFDGCFKEIVFAIYFRSYEIQNFDAFKKILGFNNGN
mgnify:CR=1 FL=1